MAKSLTTVGINSIRTPGRHADGVVTGLYLRAKYSTENGPLRKSWVLRYTLDGKRHDLGLGPYPEIGLADARTLALNHRNKLAQGVDPIAVRQQGVQARLKALSNQRTFEQAALVVFNNKRTGWKNAKHADQWINTMTTYAFPFIGKSPCGDITVHEIQQVLDPIWTEKPETASRVRQRIECVLDFARLKGWRTGDNPAKWKGNLDHIYQPRQKVQRVKNFEALPYREINGFWVDLAARDGVAVQALKFTILTAARSGMVRAMTWGELDLQNCIWTIPAIKMKADREFTVPLGDTAMQILQAQALGTQQSDQLVFPSLRGKVLSDAGMAAVLKRMKLPVTVHGFRSTFRDWGAEQTSYSHELLEFALAHSVSDKTVAAYLRGDMLEKRTRLMNDWAQYIQTQQTTSGKVTAIRSAA